MNGIDLVDGPRAARDVPPGTCWAFLEHRTLAEVWGLTTETGAAPARRRLPGRRHAITFKVTHVEHKVLVTLGFDPRTRQVQEIFINGGREGSDRLFDLQDIATIVSVALQHGAPFAALAKSLARVDGRPASIIGTVLDQAMAELRALGVEP